MKFTASFGIPASKRMSMNFAAMVGEPLAGFKTTVLPVTREATTSPAMMALGKFHGGTTTPTPSGIYTRQLRYPRIDDSFWSSANQSNSRPKNLNKSHV